MLPASFYHFSYRPIIGRCKQKNSIPSHVYLRADEITLIAFRRVSLNLGALQSVNPFLNETADLLGIRHVYAFQRVNFKTAVIKRKPDSVTSDPQKTGRRFPFSGVKPTERFSVNYGKALFLRIGIKYTRPVFLAKAFRQLRNKTIYVFRTL